LKEKEFEVLDELYFLISFNDLHKNVSYARTELKEILRSLIDKRWIRCFESYDIDLDWDDIDFENRFDKYHYLANKQGLKAHNENQQV